MNAATPAPWRHLLPKLAGLPLLPIGPGGGGKAPADPATGHGLKGWTTAAFTHQQVAAACPKITAVGFRPGPDADGLIAFDIDGATAVERCRSHGCDPLTAPTWQVRRDTDADRLKVIWRIPEDLRDHLEHTIAKLQTKEPTASGAGDGENVATYYGSGQVVVLGQHTSSGGNYYWPEGYGPEAVAEITPEWWELALEIAASDPDQQKPKNTSTATTSSSDWKRLSNCPICGRDKHAACRKHRDGATIRCYHGSSFKPPDVRVGEVITGRDGQKWAFTGSRTCGGDVGTFSTFVLDNPNRERRHESDLLDGFDIHPDPPAAEKGPQQAQGDANKQQRDTEPLTWTQLIAATLEAVREGKADAEMVARAEIMARFRRSDSQVTKALFNLLTAQEGGSTNGSTYGAVDLDQIEGMDWLVEGFIPERDQVLIWGEAGAGKTTSGVGLAFAVIDGTGFLDRASHATRGSVLFIASDSGADPLKATLQSMGLMSHPALRPDAVHRFIVWAHDAGQGRTAWDASLRGCIALLDFIRRERPALVIIDSAKAVTSKADDLSYTDNTVVTALLTFAKEVLCAHCSIVWLHHDGTAKGAAAGAKSWKEIPSCVHAIENVEMGGSGDNKGGGGPRNQPWTNERMRSWTVKKCRMGTRRDFQFEIDEATGRPALTPAAARSVVQDARAGIVEELWRAWQEGRRSLSRKDLIDAMRDQHGYCKSTTDNNLCRMVRAKHPEVCRLEVPRGHYKLAPRVVEMLTAAVDQADSPLNTSISQGKEQAKKPVIDKEVTTSREVPEGTQGNKSKEAIHTAEFPREKLGYCPPTSVSNGSTHVPSLEVFTPRAREATAGTHTPAGRPPGTSRQSLKGLWPDPWANTKAAA